MHWRLTGIAVSLAMSITLTAQAQADADGRAPRQVTEPGLIAGTVIADSGTPLARARVALSSNTFRSTVTDERGAFVFASLPPDQYTLSVSRIGYLDVEYGQRQPGSGRPGTPIRVEPGQRIDAIILRMPRGAVLTGTVVDENGEPAIAVPVRAYRWRIRGAEPTLAAASFDQTDDRGIYRIPFLPPGDYIVAATPRAEADVLRLGDNTSPPVRGSYAAVFHPGTPQPSDASLVRVGIGEERTNVDIRLQRLPTGRISGVVIGAGGTPQSGALVTLGAAAQWLTSAAMRSVRSSANGQFSFTAVPPGLHVLTARTEGGAALWGRADLTTDGRDAGGIQIVLQRGLNVTGTVTYDGAAPESGATGLHLSLTRVGAVSLAESITAAVQRNGTFALRDVPPGRYQLTADSLPAGHSLATATFGGRDALDAWLDVNEDLTGVVTVSSRSTEIAGSLLDEDRRPVSDRTILAFAADAKYWTASSRRIRAARPATNGLFVIRDLPPGAYRLAVVPDLEPGEESNPDFLQQLSAESDLVSLADGERRVHNLTLKSR